MGLKMTSNSQMIFANIDRHL